MSDFPELDSTRKGNSFKTFRKSSLSFNKTSTGEYVIEAHGTYLKLSKIERRDLKQILEFIETVESENG